MTTRKCNIFRNVWRFFEVFLFFAVSVVGFNLLVKTTSLNTKSKTNSLSRGMVMSRELSLPEVTLPLDFGIDRLTGLFSSAPNKNHASHSRNSCVHVYADFQPHPCHSLAHSDQILSKSTFFTASSLQKPANLFQQKRVLLI
jgi:hypothetical protein